MSAKFIFSSIFLTFSILLITTSEYFYSPASLKRQPSFTEILAPEEVSQNYKMYVGKRITLQTFGMEMVTGGTVQGCIPQICDCNQQGGAIKVRDILIAQAHGNDCLIVWSPLRLESFEGGPTLLTGTLREAWYNDKYMQLVIDLDFNDSWIWKDGKWELLKPGIWVEPPYGQGESPRPISTDLPRVQAEIQRFLSNFWPLTPFPYSTPTPKP